MTTRDISNELKDIYGVKLSASFISNVTDSIMPEVKAWQNRPLDSIYPIVYMDAIHIKNRNDGPGISKPVYLAIGINLDGVKEVLGMWIVKTEGAKFCLSVLMQLKNRGIKDIFIASIDGLKGFLEAIENVYPPTQVQLCIVHMVRHLLKFVSWQQRTGWLEISKQFIAHRPKKKDVICLIALLVNGITHILRSVNHGSLTGQDYQPSLIVLMKLDELLYNQYD